MKQHPKILDIMFILVILLNFIFLSLPEKSEVEKKHIPYGEEFAIWVISDTHMAFNDSEYYTMEEPINIEPVAKWCHMRYNTSMNDTINNVSKEYTISYMLNAGDVVSYAITGPANWNSYYNITDRLLDLSNFVSAYHCYASHELIGCGPYSYPPNVYCRHPLNYTVDIGENLRVVVFSPSYNQDLLPKFTGGMNETEMKWLENQVIKADEQGKMIFILCHYSANHTTATCAGTDVWSYDGHLLPEDWIENLYNTHNVTLQIHGHWHLPQAYNNITGFEVIKYNKTSFPNMLSIVPSGISVRQNVYNYTEPHIGDIINPEEISSMYLILENNSDVLRIRGRNHSSGQWNPKIDYNWTLPFPFIDKSENPYLNLTQRL